MPFTSNWPLGATHTLAPVGALRAQIPTGSAGMKSGGAGVLRVAVCAHSSCAMLKMMRTRIVLLLAVLGFKAARSWGRAPHGKIVPSHRNRRHRTRVCASSGEGLETRQGPQRIQPNTHAAAAATRSVRPHNGCQGINTELFHHSTGHAPPSPPNPPP
jgi:hypothetical protein